MLTFLLLALAVARLTWLVTEDHLPLVAKPRKWIIDRKPEGNLAYLVGCWWCVSIYAAAGAAAFARWALHAVDTTEGLLWWPALSFAAVGLMSLVDVLQAHGTEDD